MEEWVVEAETNLANGATEINMDDSIFGKRLCAAMIAAPALTTVNNRMSLHSDRAEMLADMLPKLKHMTTLKLGTDGIMASFTLHDCQTLFPVLPQCANLESLLLNSATITKDFLPVWQAIK